MTGRASNVMGGGLYTGVFAVVLYLNRRKQNVLNCGYIVLRMQTSRDGTRSNHSSSR